jgi:hypothetical protein
VNGLAVALAFCHDHSAELDRVAGAAPFAEQVGTNDTQPVIGFRHRIGDDDSDMLPAGEIVTDQRSDGLPAGGATPVAAEVLHVRRKYVGRQRLALVRPRPAQGFECFQQLLT